MINFNEAPFLGVEFDCIKEAIDSKHISGDGKYTKFCNGILEKQTGAKKVLLTNSCTAALEMSALMLNLEPDDEVICPSFTFVTTASAFALRGAKIIFIDIKNDTLNLDENLLESAITSKTKAIIPVHYAGVSCDMDKILEIARKYNLKIVEDAAQAVGSFYKNKPCGSIGDLGCYSFHETKNISCGEGGALLVNNEKFIEQAEIIREKGTNRSKFFRGQVDKYTWVDLGSSYLLSDMLAAYLHPQLSKCEQINNKRIELWNNYHKNFEEFENKEIIKRPFIPANCRHNAHMYYLRFKSLNTRTKFINFMKQNEIMCVFHYIPLHSSPAGQKYGRIASRMDITNNASETLVRLPFFYAMNFETQNKVIEKTTKFLGDL
jgi:dTDP-4-amino-4,6-dideoxygalactose transaminase